jgi:hypothetical protein
LTRISAVHHAAAELCNNVDDNCDGFVDEGSVDTDEDGVANCVDADDDNDGQEDDFDNCRLVSNLKVDGIQPNADGDTLGDVYDTCPGLPGPESNDGCP